MEVTAEHFGVTPPTIRSALSYARELGIDARGKQVSLRTRPNWSKANATLVAEYFADGTRSWKDVVTHFERSEPTIRKALEIAKQQSERTTEALDSDGSTVRDGD